MKFVYYIQTEIFLKLKMIYLNCFNKYPFLRVQKQRLRWHWRDICILPNVDYNLKTYL